MDDLRHILRQVWGYDDFRGIQSEIIESLLAGNDTLGLMPTGGGKSMTFQVPALAQEGLCLVITPLISLMKDQVDALREKGIKAAAVYAGMNASEVLLTLENCILGDYKFLYVSPERLTSELFIAKLRRMTVSFVTVDEAHCISQWGYDFRPSYLHIADIRRLLPHAPVLALTATATPEVVTDIQEKLCFRSPCVFQMSFRRANLAYIVCQTENKDGELLRILQESEGSAIVYVRSRKQTKELAAWLTEKGIPAFHYHAGLYQAEKDLRQQCWKADEVRVIVATNAFGMGIDKPDVRYVVHADLPDSPEAYFQEAGRAGRDGKPAQAILLYNGKDRAKQQRRIAQTFPDKDYIRNIYEDVAYYYQLADGDGLGVTYEFDLNEFCRRFRHFPVPALAALKILTRAGYLEYIEEQEAYSKVYFLYQRDELYHLNHTSPESEQIIQCLLRNYGGLFSDYVVIHERDMASQLHISQESIYEHLKGLNQQRILHYIPHKRTPYLRYPARRVKMEQICFAPAVYEERKVQYEKRIYAMLSYAENTEQCRSTFLLRFFGEDNPEDCHCCDVCLGRSVLPYTESDVCNYLLTLLADGKSHAPAELLTARFDKDVFRRALRNLIAEKRVIIEDGRFRLV